MSNKKSLMCRCDRGVFKISSVGVVVDDPTMIVLDGPFFADCINCGANWFVDPSLDHGNLMLSTSSRTKEIIAERRKVEWDSQFAPKPVEPTGATK